VSAAVFARQLTASLESPYLRAASSSWLTAPQSAYWRVVQSILSLTER
jgi:hypothetical protein